MTRPRPQAFYLAGPPGAGKTTLMDRLLAPYRRGNPLRLHGTLTGEPLGPPSPTDDPEPVPVGVHLGVTRPRFGGTDALSMAVLPDAVTWAASASLPPLVAGEGARLAHLRFLAALHRRTDLVVVWLGAPWPVLTARCSARGSNQDTAWRRAAGTRSRSAMERTARLGVRVEIVDTATRDVDALADHVRGLLAAGGVELAHPAPAPREVPSP